LLPIGAERDVARPVRTRDPRRMVQRLVFSARIGPRSSGSIRSHPCVGFDQDAPAIKALALRARFRMTLHQESPGRRQPANTKSLRFMGPSSISWGRHSRGTSGRPACTRAPRPAAARLSSDRSVVETQATGFAERGAVRSRLREQLHRTCTPVVTVRPASQPLVQVAHVRGDRICACGVPVSRPDVNISRLEADLSARLSRSRRLRVATSRRSLWPASSCSPSRASRASCRRRLP